MKIFFNGFWSGFHDHTNGVNDKFFIDLMKDVYDTDISVTTNLDEADKLNNSKYKSLKGRKYLDQQFK